MLRVSSDAVFNLDVVQLLYFFFVAWTFNMVREFVAKPNVMKLYPVYSSNVFLAHKSLLLNMNLICAPKVGCHGCYSSGVSFGWVGWGWEAQREKVKENLKQAPC